jgi:integrase/recombinase XerD
MPVSESTAKPSPVKIPGLVELYTTTLESHGYGKGATHAYMRAVEHFLAWCAPDSDYVEIGEASVRHFLDKHLGCCDCPGRRQRGKVTVLSALRHLLAILRAAGRIPPVLPSLSNFIISELQDYCDYANDVCGLAPANLISRRQWIGRFLTHLFPAGGLEFSQLGAKEIRNFFVAQCQGYQPGSAQVVASSVRSYLRFRALRHADPVAALKAAVPTAARWPLASLPEYSARRNSPS